jgi:hypothetical protein
MEMALKKKFILFSVQKTEVEHYCSKGSFTVDYSNKAPRFFSGNRSFVEPKVRPDDDMLPTARTRT